MTRSHVHRSQLVRILPFIGLAACTEADPPVAPMAPDGTIAASARSTTDLGVVTWEIGTEGSDARIIGRDAASARRVDLIVRRDAATPDDRVSLDVAFPERGELELTRDGVAGAAVSPYLQHLAEDVHADLGQGKARAFGGGGLGLSSTNSSLAAGDPVVAFDGFPDDKMIQIGWDLFGHGGPFVKGGQCGSGRIRDHVECSADFASNGSTCSWGSWLSPGAPFTDATIRFNVWVPGGHWDNFRWRIFCKPKSLAEGLAATQSSTLAGAIASRANDGNTDGEGTHNSVSHTNADFHAFWQVDLGTSKNIGAVVVFNRTDCCGDRLSDFDILVSDDGNFIDSGHFTVAAAHPGPTGTRTEFAMNVWGRFVRVQLRGINFLHLAEVQVFAP
jgi:hypothetical protein